MLIHDAAFGTTVVQEKLLVVYLQGFSTLHIAHKATEEIWVQIGLADVLKGLILFGAGLFIFGVSIPYWSDSEDLHGPRCARVNLDISVSEVYLSKERARVFDIELVVIEFEHLVLMHVKLFALLYNWLDSCLKNGSAGVIQPP